MAASASLRIALVAGEPSGDALGADLIQAIKSRYPHAQFVGIGGPAMQAAGLESWYPMETLSVMGFWDVLKRLPTLLALRRQLIARLKDNPPDLFIGVDAPDFNFTVERHLKAAGVLTVHYVGPSVWAWREKRLEKLREAVDGVLLLFPFEPPLYEKYRIPAAFVGHPMACKIPLQPDRSQARAQLGMSQQQSVTALLPGSRMGEVTRIWPEYLRTVRLLLALYPDMHFVVPTVHARAHALLAESLHNEKLPIELVRGQADTVLQAADQAVVFSGTATLEAALCKCPMVITGKVHPLTYWIARRLVTTPWVGLPNVLAGREIVPELLQDAARAEKLAPAVGKLVVDGVQRRQQLEAFERMHHQLRQPAGERAVDAMHQWGVLP